MAEMCLLVAASHRQHINFMSFRESHADAAYLHVLENVVKTSRQHAASGYFGNGDIHANENVNAGNLCRQVLYPPRLQNKMKNGNTSWEQLGSSM